MTTLQPHARFRLDDALNNPIRLSLMATVASTDRIEFSALADDLGVSAPVLSKANALLEGLGYLTVTKGYVGKRPRTWLSLTAVGRRAFDAHVAALREIAGLA